MPPRQTAPDCTGGTQTRPRWCTCPVGPDAELASARHVSASPAQFRWVPQLRAPVPKLGDGHKVAAQRRQVDPVERARRRRHAHGRLGPQHVHVGQRVQAAVKVAGAWVGDAAAMNARCVSGGQHHHPCERHAPRTADAEVLVVVDAVAVVNPPLHPWTQRASTDPAGGVRPTERAGAPPPPILRPAATVVPARVLGPARALQRLVVAVARRVGAKLEVRDAVDGVLARHARVKRQVDLEHVPTLRRRVGGRAAAGLAVIAVVGIGEERQRLRALHVDGVVHLKHDLRRAAAHVEEAHRPVRVRRPRVAQVAAQVVGGDPAKDAFGLARDDARLLAREEEAGLRLHGRAHRVQDALLPRRREQPQARGRQQVQRRRSLRVHGHCGRRKLEQRLQVPGNLLQPVRVRRQACRTRPGVCGGGSARRRGQHGTDRALAARSGGHPPYRARSWARWLRRRPRTAAGSPHRPRARQRPTRATRYCQRRSRRHTAAAGGHRAHPLERVHVVHGRAKRVSQRGRGWGVGGDDGGGGALRTMLRGRRRCGRRRCVCGAAKEGGVRNDGPQQHEPAGGRERRGGRGRGRGRGPAATWPTAASHGQGLPAAAGRPGGQPRESVTAASSAAAHGAAAWVPAAATPGPGRPKAPRPASSSSVRRSRARQFPRQQKKRGRVRNDVIAHFGVTVGCRCSAAFLPRFCRVSATFLPLSKLFYRCSAAFLPLFYRVSAAVLPLFCCCSAAFLPLFCRCSAAVLFCRCSATVLPLFCRAN